jgi:hypothetical protein
MSDQLPKLIDVQATDCLAYGLPVLIVVSDHDLPAKMTGERARYVRLDAVEAAVRAVRNEEADASFASGGDGVDVGGCVAALDVADAAQEKEKEID